MAETLGWVHRARMESASRGALMPGSWYVAPRGTEVVTAAERGRWAVPIDWDGRWTKVREAEGLGAFGSWRLPLAVHTLTFDTEANPFNRYPLDRLWLAYRAADGIVQLYAFNPQLALNRLPVVELWNPVGGPHQHPFELYVPGVIPPDPNVIGGI